LRIRRKIMNNERRRQLWRRHSQRLVERRQKWFHIVENCDKVRAEIYDCPDPEEN